MRFRPGIRGKIAAVIMICMVPMLLLGVFVHLQRNEARRDLVLKAQRDVARGIASGVETFIANAVHTERAAGAAVTSQPYPVIGIIQLFAAIRANDPAFLSLALLLPTGFVEAEDPPSNSYASVVGRRAFAAVRGGANWSVGPAVQLGGRPAMEVAVGIRDQGTLVAVVNGTVDLSQLRMVLPASFAPDADGVIVDRGGRVVLDLQSPTRPTNVFRPFPPVLRALEGDAADITGYQDPQTRIRELGAAVPIPSLGWGVVVLAAEASALESARHAAATELVWFLAYAGLGLALAWILGSELSAPILALARGARAIGRGELGYRVNVSRSDQLGELGRAFNEMSEQLQRYVSEMNALQAVSDAALSTVRLGELLPTLVQQIVSALRADEGVVWFVEEATRDLVVPAEFDGGPPGAVRRVHPGEGLVGRAAQRARPLVVSDPHVLRGLDPALRAQGVLAAVSVPLRVGGKVIGVIEVLSRRPREFRSHEVRLLETFADRVALAVDNARAFERQQEIAGIIQHALLPPASVQLPGLAAVGRYQPSREVGGDFYALLPLSDGRIGLAIADVSGKGIPAATLSARTRYLLEAFAVDGRQPGVVLEHLNKVLSADPESGMFVSLFYGVLDPAAGTFALANAGHPPPFILRAGEAVPTVCEASGLLLGVEVSARYSTWERAIGPGDVLVLFTDGITEARNVHGEQFGERQIAALLAAWRGGGPPQEIADRVMDAVTQWSGTTPADDQALLVVCVTPQAAPGGALPGSAADARSPGEVRAVR